MKFKLIAVLLAACLGLSCASSGGARRIGAVTFISSKATISAVQDVEEQVVCGRLHAPSAPNCISIDQHHQFSKMFGEAIGYEIQVGQIVRAIPQGAPQPAEVGDLLMKIGKLIQSIVNDLPSKAPQVVTLQQNLGGR
jgi:hypothetical protein